MVTEAGKELLRNTINTAKFHNRIIEENEMWKHWELECGLTMMVSDDDIIKRIKKNHQCSKHRRRDKSRSRDSSRNRYESAKIKQAAGSSNDRWDHSGFAELYPDAAEPDKYPSTSSFSTLNKHKKKKKSRRRSNSSDKEIWEEFKRTGKIWNKEKVLRLIELLRDAPALWNINYPGYRDHLVKQKEIKRIASKMLVEENKIMTEIEFLMNEFHKEHKKIALKNLKGACAKNSENEWFAYKRLTFLINNQNENYCKNIEKDIGKNENPQWIDSSDSYSDDETSARPLLDQTMSTKSYIKDGETGKKTDDGHTDLPYVQAFMDRKDSFSVYGEIVAHRMREAQKSNKEIAKAQKEIDFILHELETGCFDSSGDGIK